MHTKKYSFIIQKEKLAAPVNLKPVGWTGLGPTPMSGPSPQCPDPTSPLSTSTTPLPTPLPTAKSLKGSLGLRGASIGDSSTSSVADSSDLMAFSTYQDWMAFEPKKEDSKSFSRAGSWMEALKEVRERSREKKR